MMRKLLLMAVAVAIFGTGSAVAFGLPSGPLITGGVSDNAVQEQYGGPDPPEQTFEEACEAAGGTFFESFFVLNCLTLDPLSSEDVDTLASICDSLGGTPGFSEVLGEIFYICFPF